MTEEQTEQEAPPAEDRTELPEALQFNAEVYNFLREVQSRIEELRGQAGQPELAVDATALQHLGMVYTAVQDAVANVGAGVPEEHRQEAG